MKFKATFNIHLYDKSNIIKFLTLCGCFFFSSEYLRNFSAGLNTQFSFSVRLVNESWNENTCNKTVQILTWCEHLNCTSRVKLHYCREEEEKIKPTKWLKRNPLAICVNYSSDHLKLVSEKSMHQLYSMVCRVSAHQIENLCGFLSHLKMLHFQKWNSILYLFLIWGLLSL